MDETLYLCNTEFSQRTMTWEEMKDFFKVEDSMIQNAIDTGTSIPVGIRDWYVDEKLK